MANKVYLTAKELHKRWGITAQTFATMKRNDNVPVTTVLNRADLYHIDDVLAFEDKKRGE